MHRQSMQNAAVSENNEDTAMQGRRIRACIRMDITLARDLTQNINV